MWRLLSVTRVYNGNKPSSLKQSPFCFRFPKIFNLLHFGAGELRQGHLSFAGPSVRSAEKCLTPGVGIYVIYGFTVFTRLSWM